MTGPSVSGMRAELFPFIRNRRVAAMEPEYLPMGRGDLIGDWLVSDRYSGKGMCDGKPLAYTSEHCGIDYEVRQSNSKWVVHIYMPKLKKFRYLGGNGRHTSRFATPLAAAKAAEEDWQNNVACGAAS